MKKLINYTLISAVLALIFAAGSCTNPLIDMNLSNDGGEGNFALQIAVPNYDLHFAQEVSTKVVSPESRVIAVYFDEDAAFPKEWPDWHSNLYNKWDASNASNGFFYTLYEQRIDVKAGFYHSVRVELLNDWPGNEGARVITSGVAYGVTVAPWPAEPTVVHITLTPPEEMFTALTVGGTLLGQGVDYQGMKFYSFNAAAETGYSLTITPTYGEPDVYLFNSLGLRTGLELGHDIIYTADPAGAGPGLETTMSIYKEESVRMYYVGVYGWREMAEFSISLVANPTATYRPPPTTPDPMSDVELLVSDAIAALKNPDGAVNFDLALQLFTEAHLEDPNYGPAFAGYNALSAMKMVTDPDIVYMAREILGLQDYASSMTELFSGEWLQVYTTPQGWDNILPRIRNQHLKDGAAGDGPDGIIDPYERLLAFMDWFIHHSSGFGDVADVVLNKLGNRLDFVIQQIMAMDAAMSMTFTWDMIFDDFERDVVNFKPGWDGNDVWYNWPVDDHGSPIPVKLGKAELLSLASVLKIVESFINIGKAYEYNLMDPGSGENVLVDYWADFNPIDGTHGPGATYQSDVTPFETGFLRPRDTAILSIDKARISFLDGLDILQNAVLQMQSDRPGGFFISSSSPMPGVGGESWSFVQDVLAFENKAINEARASVNNPGHTFIVPIYFDFEMGYDFAWYAYGNWPTTIVPYESAGVNLGVFFSNPIAFALELGANGEPVWYEFTPYPANFAQVTSINPQEGGFVFAKVPDITLGGVIPVGDLQYIPVDDPNTRARLGWVNWDDWNTGIPEYNGNNMWDPGETIWYAEMYADVEGVIDIHNQNIDVLYPGGDPFYYYDINNAYHLSDSAILEKVYVAPENMNAFRDALNASPDFRVYGVEMLFFLDNTSFYFMAPAEVAWHSLTPAGNLGMNEWSEQIVSTGSVWWFALNQIYQ